MRLGSRIGSIARDRATWLVLLALTIGVVLPAACVIWFMTEAASNQADAARQRLSDALRGQLKLLRERVDADWRARVSRIERLETRGAPAFQRLVTSGEIDAIVFPARDGVAAYPSLTPTATTRRTDDETVEWRRASALEAYGSYRAASSEYATLAARARQPDLAARAGQAHVRALVKAGDSTAALAAIERYLATPKFAAGRDRHGRLIAADGRLLALRLMAPSDARFRPTVERLAALVSDYDAVAMPSSQRLFLMSELKAVAADVALPTYAAERLAAEFLEADGDAPTGEALEPTGIRDVWKLAIDGGAIALFRTGTVTSVAGALLTGQSVAAGTTFTLLPPGAQDGEEAIPASALLPGWMIRASLSRADGVGAGAGPAGQRRMATYTWAGTVAVAGLAIAGLLLWQAFRRQLQLNRLKTDLVAAVSHELRTPLASMRALVDLMLENPAMDRGRAQEYLQMISGENARLSRLIEHFLTFSRIDRNGHGLVFRDVSPSVFVREAAVVQGGARFPGLTVDVSPQLPALYADEDALVTVVLNLLENAYKYSGEEKRVALRARQESTRVVIEVQDNGIGIERRDRKRIFRPFYQVDQRLARERGGCGLGLSIVDFIVRAHGGHVTVESEPGSGSLFRVTLPSRLTSRGETAA
jgi:signal transduction histidine kinase